MDRMPTRLSKAGWWYLGAITLTSMAAYQSGSNVLFLALACLLSALLLNGLLSWWNFSRIAFRNLRVSRIRAGVPGTLQLDLRDRKRALPSLGLIAVIEVEGTHLSEVIRLRHSLPVCSQSAKEWTHCSLLWQTPARGWHRIRLRQIESTFPFGLLLKVFPQSLSHETLVWPALTHESLPCLPLQSSGSSNLRDASEVHSRWGSPSPEIAGLRNYRHGDPVRTIHWRKSAQLRRPTVLERPGSNAPQPTRVCFDFLSSHFQNESQLHTYCSRIARWVEQQLRYSPVLEVSLHDQPPLLLHSESALHRLLDALACIEAQVHALPSHAKGQPPHVLTPAHLQPTL